ATARRRVVPGSRFRRAGQRPGVLAQHFDRYGERIGILSQAANQPARQGSAHGRIQQRQQTQGQEAVFGGPERQGHGQCGHQQREQQEDRRHKQHRQAAQQAVAGVPGFQSQQFQARAGQGRQLGGQVGKSAA